MPSVCEVTVRRSLIAGLVLAVFAALIVALGELLGLSLDHVALLGAALGGVLGLVPHNVQGGRVGGFILGFVVAWVGFALRAAVLPDSSTGRAVAAFGVVAVIAVVCALTAGRLPLWSGLLGAAAIAGAYEETFTNAPSQLLKDSPTAATTILLAVALGYLAAALLPSVGAEPEQPPGTHRADEPRLPETDNTHRESSLDGLLTGENNR